MLRPESFVDRRDCLCEKRLTARRLTAIAHRQRTSVVKYQRAAVPKAGDAFFSGALAFSKTLHRTNAECDA